MDGFSYTFSSFYTRKLTPLYYSGYSYSSIIIASSRRKPAEPFLILSYFLENAVLSADSKVAQRKSEIIL